MDFALYFSEEGLSNPEKVIIPTIPFTVLPDALICEDRWKVVMHERGKISDSIGRSTCSVQGVEVADNGRGQS